MGVGGPVTVDGKGPRFMWVGRQTPSGTGVPHPDDRKTRSKRAH